MLTALEQQVLQTSVAKLGQCSDQIQTISLPGNLNKLDPGVPIGLQSLLRVA